MPHRWKGVCFLVIAEQAGVEKLAIESANLDRPERHHHSPTQKEALNQMDKKGTTRSNVGLPLCNHQQLVITKNKGAYQI